MDDSESKSYPIRPPGFVPWRTDTPRSPGWVENESGCHIWIGSRSDWGYAKVWHAGRMCPVYRVRYEREVGPIPEGMELDHYVCNNGAGGCCNPHHCRPVSPRENKLRSNGVTTRNVGKTRCIAGHELSAANVRIARNGSRRCLACDRTRRAVRTVKEAAQRRRQRAESPNV